MIVNKILSGVNTRGLKLISPESFEDEYSGELRRRYCKFKELLDHNRQLPKGKGKRLTIKQMEDIVGISKSSYYRLRDRIESGEKIIGKSKRPRNLRKSRIALEVKDLILKLRLENRTYGKNKLKVILEREYGIVLGATSINRILNQLKKKGKIDKCSPSQTKKKKHRNFNREGCHAVRWDYDKHCICNEDKRSIDKITVGELIQIDHMTVTKNNIRLKQFSAIDPITRIIVSEVYSNATSHTAMRFLREKVIKKFPFSIKSIQVDGGSEFMGYFEDSCRGLNIPLFVLPPSRPKYNGRVERSNRIMREEFYSQNLLSNNVEEFRGELEKYVYKYNNYRPHSKLDLMTPMEYYNQWVGVR